LPTGIDWSTRPATAFSAAGGTVAVTTGLLGYLDAQSWRHYLPRLIDYAFRRPDDPAIAVEALLGSLRPPDRYPPRLGTLTAEQEAVIVAFLETLALGDGSDHLQDEAQQALEQRVNRLDPRTQSPPRHDSVHLGQELRAPRGLRVLLEPGAGQRRLRSLHPHLPWWPAARLITARPAQPRKTYSEIP